MEIKKSQSRPDAAFEDCLENAIFISYHNYPLPSMEQLSQSWKQLTDKLEQQKETGTRLC